jgi:uncharacterized membrane protein
MAIMAPKIWSTFIFKLSNILWSLLAGVLINYCRH